MNRSPQSDKRPGLRWQFIVLAVGLLLLLVGLVFLLIRRPLAADAPPEVQPISFVESQVYTEAVVGQPEQVNPLLADSKLDRDLASLVFSGLTRVDDYGQPVPDLATGWTVSRDGLTYTFTLRDDVTWHDGQPFTAEDVAFTMALLRDPDFPAAPDLSSFWRTVETYADDDHTVRFVLTQPLSAFPEYAGIGLLPAHLLVGLSPAQIPADSFNLAPVGTGRLAWISAEPGEDGLSSVRLEPYPDYYDARRAVSLEAVVMRFYPNASQAFAALGPNAQGFGGLSAPQLEAALGSASLNVYSAPLPDYAAIVFNQQAPDRLPFFQETGVRLALLAALDREQIVAEVLPRMALLANSPMLPGTWAYTDVSAPEADPARANTLLEDAGWTLSGSRRSQDGVDLSFTLLVSDSPADQQIGERMAEQWRQVGVDVDLEVLDAADLIDRLQTTTDQGRDFDAALVEFGQGRLADPDPYPIWHQSQIEDGLNVSGFSDRDISEALEIARKDPNGVRRAELYATFQQLFMERAAAILLYHPIYHYAMSCQMTGAQLKIYVDPADRFRNLQDWRIASAAERLEVCPNQDEG
jgi:peptide/nickel transport system substrate-binding protein